MNPQANVANYLLRRINSLRNAAAHSSAMINGLGTSSNLPSGRTTEMVASALDDLGVPRRLRRARLRNPRILQMTSLAFAYPHFVPEQKHEMASQRLESLEERAKAHAEWYRRNNAPTASYRFLAMVFDAWLKQERPS